MVTFILMDVAYAKHDLKRPAKVRRLTEQAALSYVESRDPKQYHRAPKEERFVRRWLELLPARARVFDCPCGTGRFIETVTGMQLRYIGADFSPAMLHQTEKLVARFPVEGLLSADAEHLPLADSSVECVLLWRLLHHIPDPKMRKQMLREAARISRGMVLVSFHHPISFTFVRRLLKRIVTGDWQISDITHWRLAREAAQCGLRIVETRSFGKFRSINWFARLQKIATPMS
jgi:ubiquinone/menaquinone biosynthesis C-methylase UbiE